MSPVISRLAPAVIAALLLGCQSGAPDGCHAGGTPFDSVNAAPLCFGQGTPLFKDATASAGVGHVHEIPSGLLYYPRNVGGGAVLEDLDGDGDLDLYVTNGAGPKALYWNHGDGTFDECAERAGVAFPGDWTNGVSAADYDNDGDQDLYLLNHGKNRLLQNQGDGTFIDVTDKAGVGDTGVGASASWADIDGDGYLDLFVANVAEAFNPQGETRTSKSVLYRNRGDGTFEDITASFGPDGLPSGSSYIGVLADLDQDGAIDLLFTQEFGTFSEANRLYKGLGKASSDLRFQDVTAMAGVSVPDAVMGAAVLDVDGDARPDVYLTNLWGEPPGREVLLQNQGGLRFTDATVALGAFALNGDIGSGLATRTASWGTTVLDFDNDGTEDLYVVYGAMVPASDFNLNGSAYPPMRAGQQNALFHGQGGAFTLLNGSCAEEAGAGRGVVAGDVDGDGCEDLYVVNQRGPARLMHNLCASGGHFIEVKLVGKHGNRDGVGAQVTVTAGGKSQVKWVVAGTSVHSAGPKRLHFGLGAATSVSDVVVRWPSGAEQHVSGLMAGKLNEIVEP